MALLTPSAEIQRHEPFLGLAEEMDSNAKACDEMVDLARATEDLIGAAIHNEAASTYRICARLVRQAFYADRGDQVDD